MTNDTQRPSQPVTGDVPAAASDGAGVATGTSLEQHQFVSFAVNGEEYAIDIMSVREIKGWTGVTALPNQPKSMRGVLNLRGAIIPIFDLRCRFAGETTLATSTHVVIIASVGDRLVGILVDAVSDILNVDSSQIRPAPSIESHEDESLLAGLVTIGERMVSLLDLGMLLKNQDLDHASLGSRPSAAAVQSQQPV